MAKHECESCGEEYYIDTFLAQKSCPYCYYRLIADYNTTERRFYEREMRPIVVGSGFSRPPSAASGGYTLSFVTGSDKPRCERCGSEEILEGHHYCGKCGHRLKVRDA
jgi:Zn finger protein HypA/HybF involved in hydrogenase expression